MSNLTKKISDNICDAIFSAEIKEALKINLANSTEITLNKQFYYRFKNYYLKYDLEETLVKAANIVEYAKQDIIKFKLAKEQLEKLNNPRNFFNANINSGSTNTTNSLINISGTTTDNKNNQLNLNRANNNSISSANNIARSGSSQLNEDFENLESTWKKEDERYNQINSSDNPTTFDIKVDSVDIADINLEKSVVTETAPKLTSTSVSESDTPVNKISYTDISTNKSLSSSTNLATNTSKALNTAFNKSISKSNTINTSINNTDNSSFSLNFIYGDATYKSLSLYVADFKESFLSSFSTLFIEPWTGY